MSKEIVEALRLLEEEKGISFQVLLTALGDAILSAYKKTPGAVEYARVVIDPDNGEVSIYELILPERPAAVEAAEAEAAAAAEAGEAVEEDLEAEEAEGETMEPVAAEATANTLSEGEPSTSGEAAAAEEEEFDLSMYDESEIEKVKIETPEDFGRIAAQTAKQVIFQRIREAERDMMYDEYQWRKGEIVTG
ncbi:MAG: NusA N-terminal domain-containing protein, partial [Actinomycetota bacterium]